MSDWQTDIDDNGAGYGICPKCGSECRQNPDATHTQLQCTECGETE